MILFIILLQTVLRSPFPVSKNGEHNPYSFFRSEHIAGTSISMYISCYSGKCMTFSFISNEKCTIPISGVGVSHSQECGTYPVPRSRERNTPTL